MSGGVPKRVQISRIQRNTPSKAGNPVPKKAIILCNGSRAQKAMCNYILRRTHALPTPPVREGLRLTAALLTNHGALYDIVGFVGSALVSLGPSYDVAGSLTPSGAHGTEILGAYTHDLPPHPHVPPQQIHIGISGEVPTSFTFTGGDLAQPYTLKTADAHITPDPASPAVWPWLNHGFYMTPGVTYTLFIN